MREATKKEIGCGRFSVRVSELNRGLPYLKYLGFTFWVAWFGVAYHSSVWVEGTEPTASIVSQMFLSSTAGLFFALLVFAVLYRRAAALLARPWFVIASGLTASIACVGILAAGPAYVRSVPLFVASSVLTGVGTAPLGLNAGLLLCSGRPERALRAVLYCEIIAALVQFMVLGLPAPFSTGLFVALPFLSALCFCVGLVKPAVAALSESQRLHPPKAFGRFLGVVTVLGVVAYFGSGSYQMLASPAQLAADGSVTAFVTIVGLIALVLVSVYRKDNLNFGHLFYPMAMILILSLMATYFFPSSVSFGVVLSGFTFQLFDVVMWCIFVCIVYQSKASAVRVVALGRAAIALGVTVGSVIGSQSAALGADSVAVSTAVFVILLVAAVAVFFVFPESQVDLLLLPIPDEDDPDVLSKHVECDRTAPAATQAVASAEYAAERRGASAGTTAVKDLCALCEREDVAEGLRASPRRGRWKQLCQQMGDESQLTEREKEVLVMLARGYGSQSISDALTISLYTTRAHTRNIYAKLAVHSRQELADLVREYVSMHEG